MTEHTFKVGDRVVPANPDLDQKGGTVLALGNGTDGVFGTGRAWVRWDLTGEPTTWFTANLSPEDQS